MSKYPVSILRFLRAEVYAMGQQGIMNIKSLEHWDICNDMHNNNLDIEALSLKYDKSVETIRQIKRCKCP